MPRIDLPQYEPLTASPQAPRVDPHALDAEFAAGRNVAVTVAQAAAIVADIRQKAVAADEAAKLKNMRVDLEIARDKFLQEHQNDDPLTWENEFAKTAAQTRRDAMPENLSRQGRAQFEQTILLWQKKTQAEIAHTATAKTISNGIEATDNFVTRMVGKGDAESLADAHAALDDAVAHGLLSEDAAKLRKAEILPAAQEQAAWRGINSDPRATLAMLRDETQFDALPENKRATLIGAAGRNISIDNAATLQGIARFVTNGNGHHPL